VDGVPVVPTSSIPISDSEYQVYKQQKKHVRVDIQESCGLLLVTAVSTLLLRMPFAPFLCYSASTWANTSLQRRWWCGTCVTHEHCSTDGLMAFSIAMELVSLGSVLNVRLHDQDIRTVEPGSLGHEASQLVEKSVDGEVELSGNASKQLSYSLL
jgi:hypothetical protein